MSSSIVVKENDEYCSNAFLYGEYIYIFPIYKSQDLIRVNVRTYEVEKVTNLRVECREINLKENSVFCGLTRINSVIYFSFFESDIVASYDLVSGNLIYHHTELKNIASCYTNDRGTWIYTTDSENIYLYGDSLKLVYKGRDEKFLGTQYNQMFSFSGKTWAIHRKSGKMISIDSDESIKVNASS